jgi:membrane protein YqaA with SNARE-associated domain
MEKKTSVFNGLWTNIKDHHQSNKQRGIYGYMWWTSLKIAAIYGLILIAVVLIGKYLIDIDRFFSFLTDNLPDVLVFAVFTISESFLGMIPPDLFVIWASKFNSPFLFLTLLGILSYIGGVLSYLIGNWLSRQRRIKAYSERALQKYIRLVRKWGGAFIIIAALFPLSPYSMVVIAVSLLKYPFKLYLLFSISRIARFLIQGIIYLNILNFDSLVA